MSVGNRAPGRDAKGRFVSGSSGNQKGRPRKPRERPASAFDVIVDRDLTIHRNGAPQQVSVEEALQHKTLQDALAGKRLAERQVLKWILKREEWQAKTYGNRSTQRVEFKQERSPKNAKQALELLGIVSREPGFDESDEYFPRQRLEPWAVQAALNRRRRQPPLPDRDLEEIKRCTRDADEIKWPKGSRE